ncbi:riboflavin biosynthesis protein RibF [Faecalimonas sp.]
MKHVYDLNGVVPGATRIAFGSFDGMHKGHQAVIKKLSGYEGQTPVIVSYSDDVNPIIYTECEKEYLLKDKKVEIMISVGKGKIDSMTAEEFVEKILVSKLQMKSVVVGENLCFGSDKKDVMYLKKLSKRFGFDVDVVTVVKYEDKPISTNDIKQVIVEGDFEKLTKLLGHTYIMQGTVVHGKAEGRKHGMPTANLGVAENKIFPPHGVYATLSNMDGTFYRGMTSIGLRPSDDDVPIATVETWLMNFSRDIYGKCITLGIYKYIRGVKKFEGGLDEVRKQIDKDVAAIQEFMDNLLLDMKE